MFLFKHPPSARSHDLLSVGSYDVFSASAPGHGLAEGMCQRYKFDQVALLHARFFICYPCSIVHLCPLSSSLFSSRFFVPRMLFAVEIVIFPAFPAATATLSAASSTKSLQKPCSQYIFRRSNCCVSVASLAHVSILAAGIRPLGAVIACSDLVNRKEHVCSRLCTSAILARHC